MTIDEMLKSASIKTAAEKIQSILASKTASDPVARIAAVVGARNARQQ
jgi:hypothetical protein